MVRLRRVHVPCITGTIYKGEGSEVNRKCFMPCFSTQLMEWTQRYVKKALTFLTEAEVAITGAWLDCGCGYGYYARALTFLGADPVLAVDHDFSCLKYVKPPILVCSGDCRSLPVKDHFFAGLLYVNVLHSYENPHPLLEEGHRVLKRGGHLLIIEYQQSLPTAWDPYPLNAAKIETLLKKSTFQRVKTTLVDENYRPKYLVVGKKL